MTDLRRHQKLLLSLAGELPRAQVQNRLMSSTDRDLCLALAGLSDTDRDALLALVSTAKADRVRQEITLQRIRHVETRHVISALKTIIRSLQTNRSVEGQRSYLRPRPHRPDR